MSLDHMGYLIRKWENATRQHGNRRKTPQRFYHQEHVSKDLVIEIGEGVRGRK